MSATIGANTRLTIPTQISCFRGSKAERAFTLLELVVVIIIISIVAALLGLRLGTFAYWREEGFLRQLSETIVFLHHQAITDGVYYRLEFDLKQEDPSYRIGEVVPEESDLSELSELSSADADVGLLSLELAAFLNPTEGQYQNMIEPRSFPSLAKPVKLPPDCYFRDIHTMQGTITPQTDAKPYIMFSPRGFSEFAVIHVKLSAGQDVTILVNPFTGLTEIFREYKEFEWTYGRNQNRE